jgi:hypothetical protein
MAKGKFNEWITEEGLLLIEGWARDGLTDEQIAHNIGIRASTLYEWKKRFPEISESLKKGKEVVDRIVENALLKSAMGFEYYEDTVISLGGGKQQAITVKKYQPPNTVAQIFWLKNRKPAAWREKREVQVDGSMDFVVDLPADFDDEGE